MSTKSEGKLTDWAQLRFSIIGGLLASPPKEGELRKELQALARCCYRHPTEDRWVQFGASTIERWYYRALGSDDPIKALGRKVRTDAGQQKAMNQKLLSALSNQYKDYPNWSYQLHFDNLEALVAQDAELGECPSYSTVLRRMKQNGWYKKKGKHRPRSFGQKIAQERLDKWEVRSFEAEYVHALWHLDFHEAAEWWMLMENGTHPVPCVF